ncbi:MAG: S-layer homology domain-containing protein [Clostridiales bacterium]|jgi:hypothetical protein|nr:S-layer homology domain-containing protein [Clostridiales bacterium]
MAYPSELGFWGGITSGTRLPKATEIITANAGRQTRPEPETGEYKEVVFINGVPKEFVGQMTVTRGGGVVEGQDSGIYTESYLVEESAATTEDITIDRDIVFNVTWMRKPDNKKQIVYNYAVTAWNETIVADGNTYDLDPAQSYFEVTAIEDIKAGVNYVSGSQSMLAVYLTQAGQEDGDGQEDGGGQEDGDGQGDEDGQEDNAGPAMTTLTRNGEYYRYESPWSKAEGHRISTRVMNSAGWQLSYEVRPSISAYKTLRYKDNEPQAISFPGNLQEVLQVESGLAYDIYDLPQLFYGTPVYGQANIETISVFENLYPQNVSFLDGHWAQEDIRRLFALGVLDGNPVMFQPDQAMTRSQFIVALAKALRLTLEPLPASRNRRVFVGEITFPDVGMERPDYQHIMAAYRAGIAQGKGSSNFNPDDLVTLEEAIHTIVQSIGLLDLGLDPTNMTRFADDDVISGWAKQAMYAATRMGIFGPDENGNIGPQQQITKAFGAALINRMIEYMRTDLKRDYTEHIVHFAN